MCSFDPFTYLAYKNRDRISAEVSRGAERLQAESKRMWNDVGEVVTGGADSVRDPVREQRMAGMEAEKQAEGQVIKEKRARRRNEREGLARLLQTRYRAQRRIAGSTSTGGGSVNFGGSGGSRRTLLGA